MDEILESLTLHEVPDALRFVDVMQRGERMSRAEADEWLVKIDAWCRFRLRVKPRRRSTELFG